MMAGSLHWGLGCNLPEGQMLRSASHGLNGNTSALIISPVIGGDILTGHIRGGIKPAMHLSQCRSLATSHAVSRKKRGRASRTDDSSERDTVMVEQPLLAKPLGFGQGKVYDTFLEDKLLEEIERDKNAQKAALLRKKKSTEANIEVKITKDKTKSESPPTGVEVWVGNLPKKKNIERDLESAFKTVPGLLHIRPSVLGNKKTRDPICKGFGFLTFINVNFANSFISRFEQESICFGNIQKKLSYKLMMNNANASDDDLSLVGKTCTTVPKLRVRDKTGVVNASIASVPTLGIPATGLQPELIFSSTSDAERLKDDMDESDLSLDIWSDLEDEDDAAVDIELAQNIEVVYIPVKTCGETAETGKAFDNELQDFKNIDDGKVDAKAILGDEVASDDDLSMVGKTCTTVPKLRVRDKTGVVNASIASVPMLGIPATGLQPELISSSTSDAERLKDDMDESDSSLDIWSDLEDDDDAAVDIELAQNIEVVYIPVKTRAETAETGKTLENECEDSKNIDDGKVDAKAIVGDEVKEKDPDIQHLTEDEKRIEAIEERLLKKFQDVELASKERVSSREKKKASGFKLNKSKPSKQKSGNNLGSASRLKKKEREFLTGALEKYGKRTSTTDS